MKKVAVETVRNFLKAQEEPVYKKEVQFGDAVIELEVRLHLSVVEQSTFVRRVVNTCFDEDGNYRPEYMEPIFRATILQMCSNIPVITLRGESSEDGGKLMDLDAMNDLYVAFGLSGYDSYDDFSAFECNMREVCNEAIRERHDMVVAERQAAKDVFGDFSAMVRGLREVVEKISQKVDEVNMEDLMQYAGKLAEVTSGMDKYSIPAEIIRLHREERE